MSDYTVYLDEQHRIVPLSEATYVVKTCTDDTGRVIAEEWQRTLPGSPAPEHRKAIWDAAWSAALASLSESRQPWTLAAGGGLMLLVLGLLVERILTHVPALPRLRLSSLDSIEIDDRLFELVTGEARVMPHLHLSLQAGNDLILKRMKRRHSRAQSVAIVEREWEFARGWPGVVGQDARSRSLCSVPHKAAIARSRPFTLNPEPTSSSTGTPSGTTTPRTSTGSVVSRARIWEELS